MSELKTSRDPVNWQSAAVRDKDDAVTPREQWSRLQRTAMAICLTGIGRSESSLSERSGSCICVRDGRVPSRDVKRCAECLDAASAAILALS